jgi:hypothetical protein
MPMREPRRHRSVAVDGEGSSSLELRQAARAFGLEDPGRALELVEIGRETVVRHEPQVLDTNAFRSPRRSTARAFERSPALG